MIKSEAQNDVNFEKNELQMSPWFASHTVRPAKQVENAQTNFGNNTLMVANQRGLCPKHDKK